jgi:hypothetical protein
MLATECSNPIATNIEIGNQMPTILPAMSCAWVARKTARQTSQLQRIAFTNVGLKSIEHFFITVAAAISAVQPKRMRSRAR